MPKRITMDEAKKQGFLVDFSVYPPFAYKGARFNPTDKTDCFTPLETNMLRELTSARRIIRQIRRETNRFEHADTLCAQAERKLTKAIKAFKGGAA